jgi:long-subunit fatty acid transport protein
MVSPAAAGFGVGGFGGISIPIIQEDQSSGTTFGIKGKFKMIPGVALEPNISFGKYGDAEFAFGTRPGSKVTSYGVDCILGGGFGEKPGVRMYGIIGAAAYATSRDYDDDATKLGWSTGLGFEINLSTRVGLDLRGQVHVISSEGGGSKKSATITGGLNFYLGQ